MSKTKSKKIGRRRLSYTLRNIHFLSMEKAKFVAKKKEFDDAVKEGRTAVIDGEVYTIPRKLP